MSNYENKPADLSKRERFPSLREEYGTDPARFLDHGLMESGEKDTAESNQMLVRAVIRGINRLALVRAWRAVERRLADIHDREPRQQILEWLEEREAELQEQGDLDERLEVADIPPRDERVTRRTASDYREMPVAKPLTSCAIQWGSPSEQLAERCVEEGRI